MEEDSSTTKRTNDDMTMGVDSMTTARTMEVLKDGRSSTPEEMVSTHKKKKFTDFAGFSLGGHIDTPAFALLDGFSDDPEIGVHHLRVPITRLPATFGRTPAGGNQAASKSDQHFFPIGKVKALSRNQFRIDYRVPSGTLGQFSSSDEFSHRLETTVDISNPTNCELPPTGIYVLTCLGKNAIKVNGMKIEQNEMVVLPHGSTLKFTGYSMFFLLPATPSTKTMDVPIRNSPKKRKADKIEKVDKSEKTDNDSVPSSPPSKKSKIPAFKTMQDELESMETDELLSQLEIADEKDIWDRRCQFMGATISYRAVREAAQSVELQTAQATASAQAPGITKQEVVQWIHSSDKYNKWSEIMQRKLEPKSYQTNIAKAMQRAGYERSTNVSVGRHVRWYLPSDLCPRPATDGSSGAGAGQEESKEKNEGNPENSEVEENEGGSEEEDEGNAASGAEGDDNDSDGEGEDADAD